MYGVRTHLGMCTLEDFNFLFNLREEKNMKLKRKIGDKCGRYKNRKHIK